MDFPVFFASLNRDFRKKSGAGGRREQENISIPALAATLLLDKIRENTDKGHMTGAIFIDVSKAFDTLSHGQICRKFILIWYLWNRT